MNYTGTNDADTFAGTAENDNVQGLGGNDTLSGAGGDDYIDGGAGNDVIDGGPGTFDQVAYGGATTGVNVDLAAGTASDGQGGTDTISNVEVVVGTLFDDTLKGNGVNNFFRPGAGNDKVDGGAGSDSVSYETDTGPVTVNLLTGTATGANIGTDTLVSIENVYGSQLGDLLTLSNTAGTAVGRAGNDTLVGGNGDDFMTGGSGDDLLNGGAGFDAANYQDEGDDGKTPLTNKGVTINLVTGTAIDNWGHKDTLVSIELAYGSRFDDVIIGGNAANGTGASDGFEGYRGNGGNDTIDGGAGFDRAMYDNSPAAIVAVFTGNGNATVQDGWGGTDTLINFEEIRGSAFDDVFTGSDSNLLESFEGRAGNDKIDGRGGSADRVSYQTAPAGVVANLATGTASDGYGTTDTFVNIEQIMGSEFADVLTGDSGPNSLYGRAGDDKLYGGAGADFLQGGAGDDLLDGGPNLSAVNNGSAEYDTADYGGATSGVTVVLGADGTKGTATGGGVGTDTLIDIERIVGSAFNDNISGTNRDMTEIFRGGLGDDTIRGSAATGTDLGLNLADYQAASGPVVGNLATGKVTGADGNDTLIDIHGLLGSGFADKLTGDGGRNVFRGYAGNDTIDGAGGTDDLVVYDGVPANFRLQKSGATWTVTDKVGTEGTDTLVNVEYVRLGNGQASIALANPAPTAQPAFGQTDSFLFDSVYYVLNNRALNLDLGAAAQNYLTSGAAQGLKPNSWFDPVYYANKWADLKALNLDAATLFKHYNLFGVWEGRSAGGAFDKFDGNKYLTDNPDVAAYVDAHLPDFLGSRSNGAIAHYVIYGSGEGRTAVDTVGQAIKLDYTVDLA